MKVVLGPPASRKYHIRNILCELHCSSSAVIYHNYAFYQALKTSKHHWVFSNNKQSLSRITCRKRQIKWYFSFPFLSNKDRVLIILFQDKGIKTRIFYLYPFQHKAKFPIVVVNIRISPFNLKRLKKLLLKNLQT